MLKNLTENIDASAVIVMLGVFILGYWPLKTSLARKALADAKPRRNSMPIFFPVFVLLVWMLSLVAIFKTLGSSLDGLAGYEQAIVNNVIQGSISIAFLVGILLFVRRFFARGLKGFGLCFNNVHKDFLRALIILFAAWPVVIGVFALTLKVARLFKGQEFQIDPHEELKNIRQFTQLSVCVAILINASIITPVFEEVLFRGLFQTAIRSYVIKPWPAIVISSLFFTLAHPPFHMPAIFVLGVAMGYAYEKSNSLLQSIFVHALFNGLTIIAAMYSAVQS